MTTETSPEKTKSITSAIESCEEIEEKHALYSRRIIYIMVLITLTVGMFFILPIMPQLINSKDISIPQNVLFVGLAFYTLTFSVLMAIYRMHINEMVKVQHLKIGFLRVRVAGNNDPSGFSSEVRDSLTQGAFDYSQSSVTKRLKSPIEGHPGSDFTTELLNKILNSIEFKAKK